MGHLHQVISPLVTGLIEMSNRNEALHIAAECGVCTNYGYFRHATFLLGAGGSDTSDSTNPVAVVPIGRPHTALPARTGCHLKGLRHCEYFEIEFPHTAVVIARAANSQKSAVYSASLSEL